MPQLSVDTNISSDVLNAIQTILNVVASKSVSISYIYNTEIL